MKRTVLIIIVIMAAVITLCAKETKKVPSEAEVSWNRTEKGVSYAITFDREYKINRSAPFNFYLLDKDKKEITKVKWDAFSKESDLKYVFVSDKKESFVKYWFVACKYQNNEVVSCKTFSNTIEIK
ncbi:MAG TPA: hypothetical protein PKN76_06385 [bacterium]|nr:hypothetical protein [bacterium]HOG44919.1 hypothetical protein [bacterium]